MKVRVRTDHRDEDADPVVLVIVAGYVLLVVLVVLLLALGVV